MKKEVVLFCILAVIVIIFGCTKAVETPVKIDVVEDQIIAEEPAPIEDDTPDEVPVVESPTLISVPKKYQLKGDEAIREYTVTVNDKAFSPWDIIVNNEEAIRITFLFQDSEIRYDGVDVRSEYFEIVHMKGDTAEVSVEFVPQGNVMYELYAHDSDTRKAIGKITVE